jgi:hypothetical protein
MADTQTSKRFRLAGSELSPRSGLRVRPQRPARALFGLLLVAVCVVAVLVIYTRVGDRQDVLAVGRTVLAGEQLTDADLRVVSISADDSFPSVPSTARASIVGQYAKVRMIDGSLLVTDSVQTRPLVDPSQVLTSVPVPLTGVPTGLREGSRLMLVVTPDAGKASPVLVEATVAAVPRNLGELVSGRDSNGSSSTVALTVEVDPGAAATIGAAKAVAVAVLAPDEPFPNTAAAPGSDVTAGSTPVSAPAGGG